MATSSKVSKGSRRDTDTTIGSDGVLASQETLLPALNLAGLSGQGGPAEQGLRFGVFQDWGHIQQPNAIAERVNHATLSSAGIDGHLMIGRDLDLRLDICWQPMTAPGASELSSCM